MRFMMIVKPPRRLDTAARPDPDDPEMAAMGRYNDDLRKAGVLVEINGLLGTAHGARVKYAGTKRTVIDGPFSEAKEVIGGYWIIDVASKAAALEWAKKIPFGTECHPDDEVEVEVRQVYEIGSTP